jgi:hypothetical protein
METLFEDWYENYCPGEDDRPITQQDIKNAFEAGMNAEKTKHRWIPVTERLPTEEDDTEYIPNLETVNVFVSDGKHRDIGCFDLKEKCFIDPCDYLVDVELQNIVAWQPLPEA